MKIDIINLTLLSSMWIKKMLIFSALTLLILLSIEVISMIYLARFDLAQPFFFRVKEKAVYGQTNHSSVIDPLLGWAIQPQESEENGVVFEHNCMVLEHKEASEDPQLRVYISGGSSCDLTYDEANWPKQLLEEFKQRHIPVKIFVAAVAGYNSGQELLKTIRDMENIQANVHISYSGANEMEQANYVSLYEQSILTELLEGSSSKLLPNSVFFLRNVLTSNQKDLHLYMPNNIDGPVFWEQNMRILHSLSEEYDYHFLGILQAVYDYSGKNVNPNIEAHFQDDYRYFFPKAVEITHKHSYLYDFSSFFEGEDVFIDDCHLKDVGAQEKVASAIFLLVDSLHHLSSKSVGE